MCVAIHRLSTVFHSFIIDAAEEATCEWTKESTWYGALQRLRMFEDEPLSSLSLGEGKETVFMAMNRGISVRLFHNPHHKAQVTPAQLQHGLQHKRPAA